MKNCIRAVIEEVSNWPVLMEEAMTRPVLREKLHKKLVLDTKPKVPNAFKLDTSVAVETYPNVVNPVSVEFSVPVDIYVPPRLFKVSVREVVFTRVVLPTNKREFTSCIVAKSDEPMSRRAIVLT